MNTVKAFIVVLFSALAGQLLAQTGVAAATEMLEREGMENIRITQEDGVVYAAVEPTAHRGTFRGAGVAVRKLGEAFPTAGTVRLTILEYQRPAVQVEACRTGGAWTVKVEKAGALDERLDKIRKQKPSTGKIDIAVYPMVSFVNQRFDKLCEYVVSIAPSFETTLWRGNRIAFQPIFPVLWNVEDYRTDKNIHLGATYIRQDFNMGKRWQATASVGYFLYERYGVHAELKYQLSQHIDLSARVGVTGSATVSSNRMWLDDLDRTSFMFKANWYEPRSRLQMSAQGGRFLYGDYGVRGDITRHFGEYAIGLYGILTGGEHNAGFHFAIPMGGKRQKRDGFVRLRLPEYFDWEYSMVSYFEYDSQKMGRQYEEAPDVNRSAHYWQPRFVEQYLQKFLDGEIE